MKLFFKIFTLAALAAGTLSSCGSDVPVNTESPEHRHKVSATISVSLPGQEEKKALTRAEDGNPGIDTDIQTVDGLVFDENGLFIERLPANYIDYSDDGIKIVFLFEQVDLKRTVHIVANAREKDTNHDKLDFSSLTVGAPESVVGTLKTVPMMSSVENTQDHITPLVMWGRIVLDSGIMQNTEMKGVKLLRAAACVTAKTAEA